MIQSIRAVYENGVLRPLDAIELEENAEVVLTFETNPTSEAAQLNCSDPLAGISFASGLGDFAQNFDDYRFGR